MPPLPTENSEMEEPVRNKRLEVPGVPVAPVPLS